MAPAASCGPLSSALSLSVFDDVFQPRDFARHLGGERLVLVGHLDHGGEVVAGLDRVIERRDDRSSATCAPRRVAWARSWLSQKPGAAISASMAAMRDFLVSQSKRVSQLEDAFADRLRAIDVFFFHGARLQDA